MKRIYKLTEQGTGRLARKIPRAGAAAAIPLELRTCFCYITRTLRNSVGKEVKYRWQLLLWKIRRILKKRLNALREWLKKKA